MQKASTKGHGGIKALPFPRQPPRHLHLVAAMLRGGFTPEAAGKTAGGNYMRIFHAAVG